MAQHTEETKPQCITGGDKDPRFKAADCTMLHKGRNLKTLIRHGCTYIGYYETTKVITYIAGETARE